MPRKIIGIFIAAVMGFLALAVVGTIIAYYSLLDRGQGSLVAGLSPEPHQVLRVFFGNSNLNPGSIDCSAAFPVEREVVATVTPGRAALQELLSGPTDAEANGGYYTSLNGGAALKSLTIRDGVARADFDSRLGEGVGGSCRVTAIRSQITKTLMQFPTVKEVVISVDGDSETALQP